MEIKILIVLHKPYRIPDDKVYLPVLVGPARDTSEQEGSFYCGPARDDTGDNIAEKNPTYCELTALYWGWKNLKTDYLGLVHYRRYFAGSRSKDKWSSVLSSAQLEEMLSKMEKEGVHVILPCKRYYIIETLYSHYAHSHHEEDLKVMENVIIRDYPEYLDTYRQVMKRRSAHMFNMCIMRRDLIDDYCRFMFGVIGKVEEQLDISAYTDFDKRVFGRLSELLMDVWITKNNIPYKELPMVHMDGENWPHKIALFLKRKLAGIK